MSLIVDMRLYEDELLFSDTFKNTPTAKFRLEDIHYVSNGDDTYYICFWWVSGCDFGEFDTALDADSTVTTSRLITEIGDKRLYRVETVAFPDDQPLVFPLFCEYDITTLDVRRDANGLHVRARCPTRAALQQFRAKAIDVIARSIEVTRLHTEQIQPTDTNLTQKQREAIIVAYDGGYFDTPSKVTLAELASEISISPQAMSSHIRSAVKKLVEQELDMSDI